MMSLLDAHLVVGVLNDALTKTVLARLGLLCVNTEAPYVVKS
jgi:hypothetical protein